MADQGWWVINGATILAMLREVAAGADPDMIYAEFYVNSSHEYEEDR